MLRNEGGEQQQYLFVRLIIDWYFFFYSFLSLIRRIPLGDDAGRRVEEGVKSNATK